MRTERTGPLAETAREAAFAVLLRAEAAGAFVSALLYRALERSHLSDQESALAVAITMGVLRHRARLDHALASVLRRPLESLPSAILTVLRMGCYQLLEMDRIPAAAAVSESVEMARRHGHRGTARLVNAVLRRLASEGPPPPPDPRLDPIANLAVVGSHPRWLVDRWVARYGAGEAAALAAANNAPPPSTLRVNTILATREGLLAEMEAQGMRARAGRLPCSIVAEGSLAHRLPLVDRGLLVAQDEGSMLVSLAVAPGPGAVVVDACAAPGGKATHLAALLANEGRVIATDIHPEKLAALARRAAAMGATCLEAHQVDARRLGSLWPEAADAVLVDAPCSGLGVLRRRPERKWRARPEEIAGHAARQREIIDGASGAVRPGGVLVYSVCSLEPEEGPAVTRSFLEENPLFEPEAMPEAVTRFAAASGGDEAGAQALGSGAGSAGEVWLFPHRHGTDGFYVARLRRRRTPVSPQRGGGPGGQLR